MSTRDELEAALISGFAIKNAVWVENDMPCLRLGEVADYLLSQGWRPPIREITTVEELEALPNGVVLARIFADGSGPNCYVNSTDGWRASFEEVGAPSVATADNVDNYLGPLHVIWEPEQ